METPGAMHCNSFSWVVVLYDIDGPVRRPGFCNERCDMAGGQTMSKRNAPGSERGRSGRSRKGIRRASHSSMSSASFPPEVCVRAHGTIFTRVLPPKTPGACDLEYTSCLFVCEYISCETYAIRT